MDAPCGGTKKGTISQNTASTYFSIFKAGLKQAFVEGYLMVDISAKVKGIPGKQVRREYLTLEELEKLAETPFIVFGTHSLQTSWQKVLTFIPSVK